MSDLTVYRGDYGFYISGTMNNADGTPFDLTNYTVSIQIWESEHWRNPIVQGTCIVTSSTEGQWQYPIATGNFLSTGTFSVALRATKTNAQETTLTYTLDVKEAP
jgi:hypothetical protein